MRPCPPQEAQETGPRPEYESRVSKGPFSNLGYDRETDSPSEPKVAAAETSFQVPSFHPYLNSHPPNSIVRRKFCWTLRRKLLICGLALLAGPFITELGVRAFDVQAIPLPKAEGTLFSPVDDPILRYIHARSATKTIRYDESDGKEKTVEMHTNTQRFRGQTRALKKPKGKYRIICLGDSHTFGDGVHEGESWPEQLQSILPDHIEVMNCGVGGYDTLQEVLWFEAYVERFDPDLVLLTYFANDVAARGLVDNTAKHDRIIAWTHPRRAGFVQTLRTYSRAADVVCDRIFRWRSSTARERSWNKRYREGGAGWTRARDAMLRLRERCEANQCDYRVLLFPYLEFSGDVFASHSALKVVAEFCVAKQIAHFDGEPGLLAALETLKPSELRVSVSDFHASRDAYSVFATELANWLSDTGLPLSPAQTVR